MNFSIEFLSAQIGDFAGNEKSVFSKFLQFGGSKFQFLLSIEIL